MKTVKRYTALVLALVMAAMLAVSAYAATVVVKYKVYVYTSQLTFKQYDYSSSTTPSTRNLTILADSSLGSGSALYHVKYVNGALAYCIQPGVRSDDSSNYVQGSSGCWYNLPLSKAVSRWLWPVATPAPSTALRMVTATAATLSVLRNGPPRRPLSGT